MNYLRSLYTLLNHPENLKQPIKTAARILWWKANQLYFNLPVIYPLTNSTKIICEPSSSYGSYIIYARFPEPEEMHFIHSYLRATDTFVDVGANIGAVSLVAADKIVTGKIYTIEPTPQILAKCQKNIALNELEKRIMTFPYAVGDKNAFAHFVIESESEVNHLQEKKSLVTTSKVIKVPTVTLDSFFSKQKIKNINMLKVDVEGAELKVFQGGLQSLKTQKIDLIIFEVNQKLSNFGTKPSALLKLLRRLKYKIFSFTSERKLQPFVASDVAGETINLVAVAPKKEVQKRLSEFI